MINDDCQHCFKYQIKKKKKGKKERKKVGHVCQEMGKEHGIFIVNLTFLLGCDLFYDFSNTVLCACCRINFFFFFLLYYITVITEQHPRPLLYLGILQVSDGGKLYWQVEDKS